MNEGIKKYLESYHKGETVESIMMTKDYHNFFQELAVQNLFIESLHEIVEFEFKADTASEIQEMNTNLMSAIHEGILKLRPKSLWLDFSTGQFQLAKNLLYEFWSQSPQVALKNALLSTPEKIIRIQKSKLGDCLLGFCISTDKK